jgi:hypothetical protein
LNVVIDYLTARGVMDPKLPYEAPFADFDSKGVDGVFEHPDCYLQRQNHVTNSGRLVGIRWLG